MDINVSEILFAVIMLSIPGMIVDHIIRLTSSREVTNNSKIWYWCGYSLIPSYFADMMALTNTGKLFISLIFALCLGYALAYIKQNNIISQILTRLNLSTRTSLNTSWEYAFINRGNCYVVVHLTNGEVYRGFYGNDSHVSDYYEQLDLFLEQVYTYDDNAGWVQKEELDGVYIPYKEIQAVEFLKNEQTD